MNHEHNTTDARRGFVTEDAARGAMTRRPATLRRWSIAELIANGVARPPAGGTAR